MPAQQNPFAELMAQFAAQQALQAQAPPEDYSDPEAQRREAEIWAKINRGPRERADELTAKGWKDRYGIDEKSGKLSRVFAGLGEAGRAISRRNNPKFQGIADEAVDRGMKEYQVEVGPLQRELGVLSQSRTATARFQSQAKTAANAQKIKLIDVLSDAGLDNAKIAKTLGITEQEIERTKKLRAETGNIEAHTVERGVNALNNYNSKGLKGLPGAAEVWKDPNKSGEARKTYADILGLQSALKGQGVPKTAVQRSSTSTGIQRVQTDQGLQELPLNRTTTRNVMEADPTAIKQNIDRARESFLGQTPPTSPTLPGLIAPTKSPKQEPVITPDGKSYIPNPDKPARSAQFINGQFTQTGLDPSWTGVLKSYTGDMNPNDLPDRIKSRFRGVINPGMTKATDSTRIQSEFRMSLRSLADASMVEYANNKLDQVTGIPGNLMAIAKSMMADGLDMSRVRTRSQAVNTMATYILAKSGKAVTENERRILTQALPNLERDSDSTLMQKTLILHNLARRMAYREGMRINDGEMESVLNSPSGRRGAQTDSKVYAIVDAVNKATRSGKPDVTITNPKGATMVVSKQEALDLARATMEEDYKLYSQGIKEALN